MYWIVPEEKDPGTTTDQFHAHGDPFAELDSVTALGLIPMTCRRPSAGVAL